MLEVSFILLVLAFLAAVFGFTTVAGAAASVAKILFIILILLFVASLFTRGGKA